MLNDFLGRPVFIQRETSKIFSGAVAASLTFTQLPETAYISVAVTGATLLTVALTGTRSSVAATENIEIDNAIGNRGFQRFDSLTTITCSGVLSGQMSLEMINDEAEPIAGLSIIGTYYADRSYKADEHSLDIYGDKDRVPGRYKYYFETSVDVKENDLFTDGLEKFRAESVVSLSSITRVASHLEVTVQKFEANKEFSVEP